MRRVILAVVTAAGVAVPLVGGTALALAGDDRDDDRRGGRTTAAAPAGFEIEIDPELDAEFGPRPVNAVQAAEIVTRRFPGARVVHAELDEENGGPIWEIEFVLDGSGREVDVDAVTGTLLADD